MAAASKGEQQEWLVDFIAQIFQAPSWESPINQFIDTHCGHFQDVEENRLQHTTIHKDFCELVERLLESHLQQVGLSAEDFLNVCYSQHNNADFYSTVLEPLLAVDDFLLFKRLMIKRNKELELQAALLPLETSRSFTQSPRASAKHGGTSPTSPISTAKFAVATAIATASPTASSSSSSVLSATAPLTSFRGSAAADDDDEEDSFREAIAISLLEAEAARRLADYELALLEAAIAASLALEEERLRLLQAAEDADLQEAIRMSQEKVMAAATATQAQALAASAGGSGVAASAGGAGTITTAASRHAAAVVPPMAVGSSGTGASGSSPASTAPVPVPRASLPVPVVDETSSDPELPTRSPVASAAASTGTTAGTTTTTSAGSSGAAVSSVPLVPATTALQLPSSVGASAVAATASANVPPIATASGGAGSRAATASTATPMVATGAASAMTSASSLSACTTTTSAASMPVAVTGRGAGSMYTPPAVTPGLQPLAAGAGGPLASFPALPALRSQAAVSIARDSGLDALFSSPIASASDLDEAKARAGALLQSTAAKRREMNDEASAGEGDAATAAEVRRRQEHFRKQRDRLLEKRRLEREQALAEHRASGGAGIDGADGTATGGRSPTGAKHRAHATGTAASSTTGPSSTGSVSMAASPISAEERRIAMRMQLAAQLKADAAAGGAGGGAPVSS